MAKLKYVGLILAGGHSRRFGSDKALYHEPGQLPQVQQVANVLQKVTPEIWVSVNTHNQRAIQNLFKGSSVHILPDQPPFIDQGPLSGIYALSTQLSSPVDILLLATDYPNISLDLLQKLVLSPSTYVQVNQQAHYTVSHFQVNFNQISDYLTNGQRRLSIFLKKLGCRPLSLSSQYQEQLINFNQRGAQK